MFNLELLCNRCVCFNLFLKTLKLQGLADLYLTKPVRDSEEVKQLFEAHLADLEEIVMETKIFNDMIEADI